MNYAPEKCNFLQSVILNSLFIIPISMCLATYGQIKKIYDRNGFLVGEIDFAGLLKEIDLALSPDSKVDDNIVAHGDFGVR